MRYDLALFIIGIISQIASLIITYESDNYGFTAFVSVSLATVLILFCGFWLVSSQQTQKIVKELSSRLPPVSVMRGEKIVFEELRAAASHAQQHIYATGSAARNKKFLDEIDAAVNSRNCTYVRILYRRHVSAPLKDRLRTQINKPNVNISKLDEDHYGYYFITEYFTGIVVPNIDPSGIMLIRIDDEERASAVRKSFEQLSAQSEPIQSRENLEGVFSSFQSYGE
jgi:hypothetical protein